MYCGNCGKRVNENDLFCGNCGAKIDKTSKLNENTNIQADNKKAIKISLRKMLLIVILVLILICIISVSIVILFNNKKGIESNEQITTENTLKDNNNTLSKISEEDNIDFAVRFMQEYEFLLNFYGKVLGYYEKPYESIKINSISLAEYEDSKYVLADFTIITKDKESIFRYGIQAQPSMKEEDIRLFLKDTTNFKKQKQDTYTKIQNNNTELIELDVKKVQEKFENESLIADTVMKNVMKYKEIANSIDFDQLAWNEYIFVNILYMETIDTSFYYANFRKDNNIVKLPISASCVSNGNVMIPNGIYKLKLNGKVYKCEYSRLSNNAYVQDNIANINEENVYVFYNDASNSEKYITISFIQKNLYRATYNTCSKYGEIIDISYDEDTEENLYYCKIKVAASKKDYVLKELSNLESVSNIKVEE